MSEIKKSQEKPAANKEHQHTEHGHFSLFSNKMLITIFAIIEIAIIGLMYPEYMKSRKHSMARKYAEAKEYDKAIQNYEYLRKKYPLSVTIPFEMGNTFLKKKDYKNALENFLFVLENQKEKASPDMIRSIGICYLNLGDRESGVKYLQIAVGKMPNDPDSNFYLGEDMLKNKKYREAADYFHRIPDPDKYGEQLVNYWKEIETAILGNIAASETK